jgi:hypothetical protein
MNFKTTVERELKKVPSSIPSVYIGEPITTYHFTKEEFEQAMTNAVLAVVEEIEEYRKEKEMLRPTVEGEQHFVLSQGLKFKLHDLKASLTTNPEIK